MEGRPRMKRLASKADLRQEIAELRHVGGQMANLCFNLGQLENTILTLNRCEILAQLSKNWDAIRRREALKQ